MISKRLKTLRKKAGLTQIELAKQFNVSNSTVAMWETERREPDLDTIGKLADFFHVSVDYLLGRDEKKEPTLVSEGRLVQPPPEYEFLSPVNKAIADRLIADLVKSQPPTSTIKLKIAAEDGSRVETEMDIDPEFKLPGSVQALPDEYKGKTGDTPSAPPKK